MAILGEGERGQPAKKRRASLLSPRQARVLTLHARGMIDKEIAAELGLSLRTVRAHMWAAMDRLHARTRAEAVLSAVRSGALRMDDSSATPEDPGASGGR